MPPVMSPSRITPAGILIIPALASGLLPFNVEAIILNIQVGIGGADFNFTSLEVAQLGQWSQERDFVDFLLFPSLAQPLETLTAYRFNNEMIATPASVLQSSVAFANSQHQFSETADYKRPLLTPQEMVETGNRVVTSQPIEDSPVEGLLLSPQQDARSVSSTSARELLTASVSRQTIAAIEYSLVRSTPPVVQSITVEIHPRDLGLLNIQIELVADSIQARIVASETLSAELLNRNKDELVNALSDFGYSQTDVDISHQHSQSHQAWDGEMVINGSMFSDQKTVSPTIDINTHPALLVGVDLVA